MTTHRSPIEPALLVLSGRWFLNLQNIGTPCIHRIGNEYERRFISAGDVAEIRGRLLEMPGLDRCYGTQTAIDGRANQRRLRRIVGVSG